MKGLRSLQFLLVRSYGDIAYYVRADDIEQFEIKQSTTVGATTFDVYVLTEKSSTGNQGYATFEAALESVNKAATELATGVPLVKLQ